MDARLQQTPMATHWVQARALEESHKLFPFFKKKEEKNAYETILDSMVTLVLITVLFAIVLYTVLGLYY